MNGISLWHAISKKHSKFQELTENLEVDVLVIGAGITGMTAASALLKAGKTVAIVDAHEVGGVTTGSSTGNLYIPVQPFYQNIVSKFDLKTATEIAQSRLSAIDYIEKNVNEYKIRCHFVRRPWYAYAQKKKASFLEKEYETFKQMNVEVDYTDQLPFDLHDNKAIVMPNQARFNPLQYVISMVDELVKQGCKVYENTSIISMKEDKFCTAKTEKAKITAKKIFMATHTPLGINSTHLYTAPYRSYVLGVRLANAIYPDAQLWKLDEPTFSISTHAMHTNAPEILLVAGSHHKTGQDKDMKSHYSKIESFIKKHFPVEEIIFHWSAQHYHAADDVPYIGLAHRSSKHIYMATGYFADGLVYGTLGGQMIADQILKDEPAWNAVYRADRFTPVASAGFVARENLNVMGEYISDLPLPETKHFSHIKQGEGKVIEIQHEKWAVSRDEDNQLHAVSAVCTHMKCIVNWNNAEKTWDCPCHGSRFTTCGQVIEGPATVNLKKKPMEDKS